MEKASDPVTSWTGQRSKRYLGPERTEETFQRSFDKLHSVMESRLSQSLNLDSKNLVIALVPFIKWDI